MSASKVRMGQAFVEIGADPGNLFAGLNKIQKQMNRLAASLQSIGGRMSGIGAAAAAPLALATRQFAQFDDAVRMVAAVSGAGGAELQALNDTARRLGATTSFTAVEVANLMTELGRAGFNPSEIQSMTGAVLDLARATGTEAALGSSILASTLRQFGLGAEDATRAADVLTAAANMTNVSVEGLGESLKYAGPVASQLGMSLEDTTAILGILGNVGIQGSEAGTALRRLSVISAGAGDDLQRIFGITNVDAGGGLKPLVQVLDEIAQVTANMPVAERTAKMAEAFGLLGITSANVLSNTADGVADLAERLQHAEGTAAKAAKAMDAGLGGSFRIALSAIEGTSLAIGDALGPSLQAMTDFVGQAATALTRFVKENEAVVIAVAKGIAGFVGVGAAIFAVGTALSVVAGTMAAITSPLGIAVAAVASLTAGVGSAAGVFDQLGKIAGQVFGGIGDAIAGGDLAGAMDVLWAGLTASWTRGVSTLMNYVDPWLAFFQNSFTYLSTELQVTWERMWAFLAQNTWGQYLLGAIDNIVNTAMASFDWLVGSIQKAWAVVQDYITGGRTAERRIKEIDSQNAARAEQRRQMRPGIEGRTNQSAAALAKIQADSDARIAGLRAGADRTADERLARRGRFAAEADAAQAGLNSLVSGAALRRGLRAQADSAISAIDGATTMDQLRDAADEFHALAATGQLAADQVSRFEAAADAAAERLETTAEDAALGVAVDPAAMSQATAAATKSQAEVVGTFSSIGLGGLGFGGTLAQQQLDALKKIERNTNHIGDDGVIAL